MALLQCRKRKRKVSLMDLPEEVLVDIFSRLPPVSIINLRRDFRNIVLRPEFERLYHQSRHSSSLFIVVNNAYRPTREDHIYEYHQDVHRIVSTKLNFTDLIPEHEHRIVKSEIVGCYNCSLLVLRKTTCYSRSAEGRINNSLHLVNPITRCNVKLIDSEPAVAKFGLGYSSSLRLYKVVHLHYSFRNESVKVLTVDLINSDNNHWRDCSISLDKNDWPRCKKVSDCFPYAESSLALCGAIYWLVPRKNSILGFDVDKEVFDLVPLPPYDEDQEERPIDDRVYSQLNALGGSLCVLETSGRKTRNPGLYHVWVMKEHGVKESWTRLATINIDKYVGKLVPKLNVIDVLENGVLLLRVGSLLRLYDPEHQKWDNKKEKRVRVSIDDEVITNFLPSFLSFV